jgi:hypothetical protein
MAHGRAQHKRLYSQLARQGSTIQVHSTTAKDHLTATMERNQLAGENDVGQVQELQALKTHAAQHKTQNGGIDLTSMSSIAVSCLFSCTRIQWRLG